MAGPVVPAVRDAVNAIDPDLALGSWNARRLGDRSRAGPADAASRFATIGGLALVFSGVASTQRWRTPETPEARDAVRMALGAQATRCAGCFSDGAWVISAGVVLVCLPHSWSVGCCRTLVGTESRDVVTSS